MSALSQPQDQEALEPRRLRRVLVGRPMRTGQLEETLLPKWLALPIFASDPLSSVAYATESGMVVLLAVGAASLHLIFPISIAIAALLAIVVLSYRQTVRAYETSGGAYVVARENLGTLPSLVAAAALLTDYVLTVAVSISAGIFAITSFAPSLASHVVGLSLACLVLIAVANLRGVRETGILFALPTYAFVTSIALLVGAGLVELATGHAHRAVAPHALPVGTGTLGLFVLLRAFSSGSTALTGVEAIANGVNAFRHPQGKNAAKTLAVLGTIAIALFLGVSYLAVHLHARPSATTSVVSQVARAVFPAGTAGGFLYYVVQTLTLIILVLAANTSFQGFPRLAALLGADRFFGRQFTNLGDRLVFSNGILVLTTAAGLLLWIYHANVNNLIHLYVVGVFTAFTLSQAGMVRYWRRTRVRGWRSKAAVNAVGGCATGLVTAIVIWTKFAEGAWLVTVAIPVLVVGMLGVRRHYDRVARRLRAGAAAVASAPVARNHTLLLVESLDAASERALGVARRISDGDLRAIHVPVRGSDPGIRPRWFAATGGAPLLEELPPNGGAVEAVLDQLWRIPRSESEFATVVVPELFRRASLLDQLRRPLELALKLRLLAEPNVAVVDVPTLAAEAAESPRELAVRIFVSGANAASMRAVNWAQALGVEDTRAVHFAFGLEDALAIRREWRAYGPRLSLDVDEAPYRDIGVPLLAYLRELTGDGKEVLAVMPELQLRGWARLLHNQRALYVKRLLLFEPRVLLASVPYQLLR
ncbi:MAG TPA: APC family permease [Gaiellaceae bacterium]|nr:APC family permease [Gaiellaceae bacterium]